MVILGISCYFHDAAAALLVDGQLIAAAAEERFSRKKHDASFPVLAINFCLRQANLTGQQVNYVVFYEKPLLKFDRILLTCLANFPRALRAFQDAMAVWLPDRLWLKADLVERLNVNPNNVLFCSHHLAHAASAYYCSPFERAAVLSIDGVGEWATAAFGAGENNTLRLSHELRWPHSLGLLYATFTAYLGFAVNDGEYKLMGLAAYGKPRFMDKIARLVTVAADGSLELRLEYFSFHHSTTHMYSAKFVDLWGPPRSRQDPCLDYLSMVSPVADQRQMERAQHFADIAASIQTFTELTVANFAKTALAAAHNRHLCLAGGVAHNSAAVGALAQTLNMDGLFVQPAAGDDGAALGAALWAWHCVSGGTQRTAFTHAFWGQAYSPGQTREAIERAGLHYREFTSDESLVQSAAAALAKNDVIAWHQGRFEWGARALGNRSILANPANAATRDLVNRKIKFRERFRPFGASVKQDRASEFFVLPHSSADHSGDFMLAVRSTHQARQEQISAVVHCNGSSRPHLVAPQREPLFYNLLEAFEANTGMPLLLNTSLNLAGLPLASSPEDSLLLFKNSDIDHLFIGPFMINRAG